MRALLRSRTLLALGLDSISLVEVLLDCERRFGIPPLVDLLEGPPLTVGRLIEAVRAAAASENRWVAR